MRIQTNVPRNPYATLALMMRQGPLGSDGPQGVFPEARAPLAQRLLPGISHSAPVLRSQLLARVERYEGLGERLTALHNALTRFALPASQGGQPLGTLSTQANPESGSSGSTPPSSGQSSVGSGGTATSSSQTRTVSHAAVMLGTQRIALTPPSEGTEGKPATRATLTTSALELSPTESTSAELKGDAIALGNDQGFTRFGKVTLNGKEITFSPFKGDTKQEAARFVADRINHFKAQTGVEASVDPETGDRLVLRSLAAGSQGTIAITQVQEDGSGSLGFSAGDRAQGEDGAANLGDVTINGVKTQFGTKKHASVQDALAYMAARLNDDHEDLEATVDGNRLILATKATGSSATLRVDAVTHGTVKLNPDDSSNGFTAGATAHGSDAESGQPSVPGVTDFGRITINGIETVFGRLDNRDFDDASAARFLAERINETNATVRATVEDGRLKLTSTEAGEAAGIRIDAVSADSDGDRGNDREVGFLAGTQASGSVTKETSPSSSSPSAETGTSGGSATTAQAPGLTDAERSELSSQFREWTRLTNAYLSALDERSEDRGDLRAFGRTIGVMLKQDSALSGVGVSVEGGRLSLDEEAFLRELESDPRAALGALQQFRDTLDPLLASQAHAMAFMREVADATRDRVPEISQAKSMIYRLEQRSKEVSLWLDSLEKLMPDLSAQGDRLSKLGDPESEDARKPGREPEDAKPNAWPWEPSKPAELAASKGVRDSKEALP